MRRAAPAYAKRRDRGENDAIKKLRQIPGVSVRQITQGGGVPDLLIGYKGLNLLIEWKAPRAETDLTPDQIEFMLGWKGQVEVATSFDECLAILGIGT